MSHFRQLVTEIHRRSLWQVLGVYAVASWIIYQIVLGLYEGIGLPQWVPGTALVLLLIGLPIVLATAFVEEGAPGLQRYDRSATIDGLETTRETVAAKRAAEEPGDTAESGPRQQPASARPNPRSGTLFTWPKALTGGLLAFAALGLGASGFMGMRALGVGPAATLISSGVLEARDPILLSDFGTQTGDSVLAVTVTETFRVALEQSRAVRLATPGFVADALRRMLREDDTSLDPSLAREMAQREGLKAVIEGDVSSVGPTFVLTARVLPADGAEPLVSVREVARDSAGVIEAVDRLAAALRERVGESLRDLNTAPALARVTTGSLDALRKYSQGIRTERVDRDRARTLYEEAIAADSSFAMAWRKLGSLLAVEDRHASIHALMRAKELADHLPERERYHALAIHASEVLGDRDRAIQLYQTLLDMYPDDGVALHNLAREYTLQLRPEDAVRTYERRIALDPGTFLSRTNLLAQLAWIGQWEEYDSLLADFERVHPEHPAAVQIRARRAASRGEFRAAEELFGELARTERGRSGLEATAVLNAANLAAVQGRLREARAGFERYRQLARRTDRPADVIAGVLAELWFEVFLLGDGAAALHRLDLVLRQHPLESIPLHNRPYLSLATFFAAAGEANRAESLLEEYRDSLGATDASAWRDALLVRIDGFRAQAAGDFEAGAERMREFATHLACSGCVDLDVGRAHDLAGNPEEARLAYARALEHRFPLTGISPAVGLSYPWLPTAYRRLAELEEERGDRAQAAQYYRDFIELWHDADPELQPHVEAARRALARLAREGGA